MGFQAKIGWIYVCYRHSTHTKYSAGLAAAVWNSRLIIFSLVAVARLSSFENKFCSHVLNCFKNFKKSAAVFEPMYFRQTAINGCHTAIIFLSTIEGKQLKPSSICRLNIGDCQALLFYFTLFDVLLFTNLCWYFTKIE